MGDLTHPWNVHRKHPEVHQWANSEGTSGASVRQALFKPDLATRTSMPSASRRQKEAKVEETLTRPRWPSKISWERRRGDKAAGVKPIILQYCRQQLCQNMSPPVAREALHWAATMDMLLEGRVSSALDVMCQRLKSLEGLASNTEVNLAGQAAHQEAKVMHRASSSAWERPKGKDKGGKSKWKEERSETKGEKGKKDKGDGKKKAQ